MKLLIVRGYGNVMNLKTYNCQEIGLAKALSRKGIECGIVFFNGKQENRVESIKVDDNKEIRVYWLKGISLMKHGIMSSIDGVIDDYDIVWVNEFNQYTSYKICKRKDKKVIIYHGPYSPTYSAARLIKEYIFNKLFFRKSTGDSIQVITKSELATSELKKIGFKKVNTLGVGLDIEGLEKISETPDIVSELKRIKEKNGNILTYVGAIDDRRNTIFLLHILKEIVNENNNVKLLIIGKGNKKYLNRCFKFIKKYELDNHVIYKESIPQNQLKYIYKNSDCFLLPTKYEIFGMVLMEAMYYKLPVITTQNGGASTLIQDCTNGYICSQDYNEWVERIKTLLDNPNLRKSIGCEANKTIKNDFTWDAISEKAKKYLETL